MKIFDGIDYKSTGLTTIVNGKQSAYFGNKLHFQPSLFHCIVIHCKTIKLRDDKLTI